MKTVVTLFLVVLLVLPMFSVFLPKAQALTGTSLVLNINPSATAHQGDSIELWGRLFDSSGSVVLYKTLKFYVNGALVGSGTGTGSGWVSVPYTVSLGPGSYPVRVSFDGDSTYSSSSTTSPLTVVLTGTYITVSIDPSATAHQGDAINLMGKLFTSSGTVILGKTLNFFVNGVYVNSATTGGGGGWAEVPYIVNLGLGSYEVRVTFNGDSTYSSSYGTTTLTVVDSTAPTVTSLSIAPASVSLGGTFTISYSVSDTGGSGLLRVELWRANIDGSVNDPSWAWVKQVSASGNSYSSSFTDTPSALGNYWYGIHVVDNAGNTGKESPSQTQIGVVFQNSAPWSKVSLNGVNYNLFVNAYPQLTNPFGRPLKYSTDSSLTSIYAMRTDGTSVDALTARILTIDAENNALFCQSPPFPFETIYTTLSLDQRSNYSLYVVTGFPDRWKELFLYGLPYLNQNPFNQGLDSDSYRAKMYAAVILEAALQTGAYNQLSDNPGLMEELGTALNGASNVLSYSQMILSGKQNFVVDDSQVKSLLDYLTNAQTNTQLGLDDAAIKQLGKLSSLVDELSSAYTLGDDAFRLYLLGTLANAQSQKRLNAIANFLELNSANIDPAIIAGLATAQLKFTQILKGYYDSIFNVLHDNPVDVINLGISTLSLAATFAGADELLALAGPYFISFAVYQIVLAGIDNAQTACLAATLERMLAGNYPSVGGLPGYQTQIRNTAYPDDQTTQTVMELYNIDDYLGFWFHTNMAQALSMPGYQQAGDILSALLGWNSPSDGIAWNYNNAYYDLQCATENSSPYYLMTELPDSNRYWLLQYVIETPTLASPTGQGFPTTFSESGLAQGTYWSATINGQTLTSTASSITFYLPNGVYSYSIICPSGYALSASQQSGTLNVNSAPVTQSITFQRSFRITFDESGLAQGTYWSVTVNGETISSSSSSIAFHFPNGDYFFSVSCPSGYTSTSMLSGKITINGVDVTMPVEYQNQPTAFPVTFIESGLPLGISWSMTFNGLTVNPTSSFVTFNVPNGNYAYSIVSPTGYVLSGSQSSGSMSVSNQAITQSLMFAYHPSPPFSLPLEFDFGSDTSPVETGAVQVTESTLYSAATGYGWSSTSGLASRDRSAPDNLRRDFVFSSTKHEFKVDLANGYYLVTVTVGDQNYMHDAISVYAQDNLVVNGLTVPAGTFQDVSFKVNIANGQLNLTILDNGGGSDPNWALNALTVTVTSPPPSAASFDFGTSSSPVQAGYTRVSSSTAYSVALGYGWSSTAGLDSRDRGSPDDLRRDFVFSATKNTFKVDLANGYYLVTVTVGDQNYMHDGISVYAQDNLVVNGLTVPAGTFQDVSFKVNIANGQLNLTILDNGWSDPYWVLNALAVVVTSPPPSAASFDFGTSGSPIEAGYTQVSSSTAYSVSTGYGWTNIAGLDSRDRGAPDNLRRDFVFSSTEHTFNVDLANGKYTVTVVIGDQNYMHDQINVYAEDNLVINHLTASAGTFQQVTFTATIADGKLNLRIRDDGGTDPNWVLNAITIGSI